MLTSHNIYIYIYKKNMHSCYSFTITFIFKIISDLSKNYLLVTAHLQNLSHLLYIVQHINKICFPFSAVACQYKMYSIQFWYVQKSGNMFNREFWKCYIQSVRWSYILSLIKQWYHHHHPFPFQEKLILSYKICTFRWSHMKPLFLILHLQITILSFLHNLI